MKPNFCYLRYFMVHVLFIVIVVFVRLIFLKHNFDFFNFRLKYIYYYNFGLLFDKGRFLYIAFQLSVQCRVQF